MRVIEATKETMYLGWQGENLAAQVVFDVLDWLADYGTGGVFLLLVRRPGETDTYQAEIETDESAGTVTWAVTGTDTAFVGQGNCQLLYYVDDALAKDAAWKTLVREAMDNTDAKTFAELAEAAADRAAEIVAGTQGWVNVANFADGALTGANLAAAVTAALEAGSVLYIPPGEYADPAITLDTDCEMHLDAGCRLCTTTSTPVILAEDCRFSLFGGTVYAGLDNDSRDYIYGSASGSHALIRLVGCAGGVIEGVTCPWSKYPAVIELKDCGQYEIRRCTFENVLMSAVHILDHCVNIAVRECRFFNSDKPTGRGYCYFVYTGGLVAADDYHESSVFVPPDGLIYENNYCEDSEDCGLDTHGARNVIMRGNTVLECVCALTAYNDNRRVKRPDGWSMDNVLLENNVCVSSKDVPEGTDYPHSFIFLGAANTRKDTDIVDGVDYADNPGSYDAYRNLTVRGNVFRSPNSYLATAGGLLYLGGVSRNVVIENNVIDTKNSGAKPTRFTRTIDFRFENNRVENCATPVVAYGGSIGVFRGNTGTGITYNTTSPSYWEPETRRTAYRSWNSCPMVDACSVVPVYVTDESELGYHYEYKYDASPMGIRLKPGDPYTANKSLTVTVTDGAAECDGHLWFPGLAVHLVQVLEAGSTATPIELDAYVADVIDMRRLRLVTTGGSAVSSGTTRTYTATILEAALVDMPAET